MPTRADLNRLIAELQMEAELISELQGKNEKAKSRIDKGAQDELDWAALGYTIHNIYNALENYCIRIAKYFENSLNGEAWHKDLINRMTLDVQDVRPALFDRETAKLIQELRAFRHVFRNVYQSELDPEKTALVQKKVGPALHNFFDSHNKYIKKLIEIRENIEE